MADNYQYPGEELELFEEARSWKRYFAARLKPYIQGKVLEVGAGLGETTPYLLNEKVTGWTCLEPDARLFGRLAQKWRTGTGPIVQAKQGSLKDLPADAHFDTILYIDVLEHIEDDRGELEAAARHLSQGGRLIVLSPAYQSLYSPFDKAIGHYRRYSSKTLRMAAAIPSLAEEKIFFLESTGMFLLFLNKHLVRKPYPSKKNIALWERLFIPVSRVLDRLLLYRAGKTIIGIWKKAAFE